MTIVYKVNGKERTLFFDGVTWRGDDADLADMLNRDFHALIGRHEYYPTPWHMAKAVADALEGTLDEPEPAFETGEKKGRVY